MKISDLQFSYPDELVAVAPQSPPRVMLVENQDPREITLSDLLDQFSSGDVLVINDTKVLKRRVFAQGDLEILFLSELGDNCWEVLFPSRKFKLNEEIILPENKKIKFVQKGRPQIVKAIEKLDESYFARVAELPLPPYIQKARHERHNIKQDENWYQTAWAKKPGSFAAPTASLHFKEEHLQELLKKGVRIEYITLHVGLGTFLPVTTEDLDEHEMHEECVEIFKNTIRSIEIAQKSNKRIWALGTTVARSLESWALGLLPEKGDFFSGRTKLLIQPGFEFKVVDCLLTNFHQPESTLFALVSGFAGLDTVKRNYEWAIKQKFRLFSYGDLTVWK